MPIDSLQTLTAKEKSKRSFALGFLGGIVDSVVCWCLHEDFLLVCVQYLAIGVGLRLMVTLMHACDCGSISQKQDRKLYSFAWIMLMSLLLHCLIASMLQSEDRKLYSSASVCVGFLLSCWGVVGSLHDGIAPDTPATGSNSSADGDLELRRQREWAGAEETYGLLRPGRNEDVVYIHRQTSERFAMAPHSWDPIPVGHDVLPEEILADIAR